MLRKSFALLLLMALFLTACGNKPPMPTIKAGDQKVPVEMGTYSWRFLTSHVTADSAGPADMVDVEQDAVTVPPGTKLSISFRSKPKKMELNTWEGNNVLTSEQLTSSSYTLPSEKGTYIYSVRAEWRKGSGLYAFVIKVE